MDASDDRVCGERGADEDCKAGRVVDDGRGIGAEHVGAHTRAHTDDAHKPKDADVLKEQKAWGIAGRAKAVRHTVAITMTDNMRFTPDRFEVRQGETVRIVLAKRGQDAP
jgi:hypothetical protein